MPEWTCRQFKSDTAPDEILGSHDYGQELTISLSYHLKIGRKIAKSDERKEI